MPKEYKKEYSIYMDEIFQNILKLNILFVHKLSWSNVHAHPFMNIIVGEVLEQCQHR
jgi:hypothetical protein